MQAILLKWAMSLPVDCCHLYSPLPFIIMQAPPRWPHRALHPVRPYSCLSVLLLTGHWGRIVKIVILADIFSTSERKMRTVMTSIPCCTFRPLFKIIR